MIEMVPENENKNNEAVQEVPFEAKDINLENIKTDIIPLDDEIIDDDELNEPIPVEDYIFGLEVRIKSLNSTLEEKKQELNKLKENYNILKNNLENKLYEKSFNSTINELSQRLEEKNQQNIEMEQMISSLNNTLILKDQSIKEITIEFDKQLEMERLTAKMAISNYITDIRNLKQSIFDNDNYNHELQKKLECIDFIIKSK